MDVSKRSVVASLAALSLALSPLALIPLDKPTPIPATTTSAPFAAEPPQSTPVEVVVTATPAPTPEPTQIPTPEPTVAPTPPPATQGFNPFNPLPRNGGGDDWDGLLQAYFGANWQRAKAIMFCESGGNSNAIGDKSLTYYVDGVLYGYSVGLFQVRFMEGRPAPEWLLIPENNIRKAAEMSGGGVNWSPWSCSRKV